MLAAVVGLVGCFLPLSGGESFFALRDDDPVGVWHPVLGFLAAIAVGVVGSIWVLRRYNAIVAAFAFLFVIVKLRDVLGTLFADSLGGRLVTSAPFIGLAMALVAVWKAPGAEKAAPPAKPSEPQPPAAETISPAS